MDMEGLKILEVNITPSHRPTKKKKGIIMNRSTSRSEKLNQADQNLQQKLQTYRNCILTLMMTWLHQKLTMKGCQDKLATT